MKIFVNDEPINISLFDDLWIILNRYSLPLDDALPSYFRFVESDIILREDLKLNMEDVRDVLVGIEPEDFTEEKVRSIRLSYPHLSYYDVVAIYIDQVFIEDDPEKILIDTASKLIKKDESLPAIRKKDFDAPNIVSTIEKYREKVETTREILSERLDIYDKNISDLSDLKPIKIHDFLLDSVSQKYLLRVPLSTPLVNMFDIMNTSSDIPFIHFHYKDQDWFKVDSQIIPAEEWLIETTDKKEDGIYFKIFNAPRTKISSRIKMVNLYSDGYWDAVHEVSMEIKIRGGVDEKIMKDRFLSVLPEEYQNIILKEVQKGVRGTLRSYIQDHEHPLNRAIFADMVSNDPLFSSFLYFNEIQTSVLLRKTLTFFYRQAGEHLKIFIKPQADSQDAWIDIIVVNATNVSQVESFKLLFSNLLSLYNKKYDAVYKKYTGYLEYIGKNLLSKYEQKMTKKKDKKSGPRIRELKARHPEIFQANYSRACPQERQPYLIEDDDVDDVIEQHGLSSVVQYGTDNRTKRDVYYGCLPRKKGKKYRHAGLKYNKYYDIEYVPCCYSRDKTEKVEEVKEKIRTGQSGGKIQAHLTAKTGHLLAPGKLAPINRFAKMPYYLTFMISDAKYKMKKIGDDKMYPFLSLGVLHSPDSFFHCVAAATKDDYITSTLKEKVKFIRQTKEELAESEDILFSSSQELYGYPLPKIQDILINNDFIDARMWIRAAERQFNCRIFLYDVSPEHPKGEILIPRHSGAYLRPKDNRKNYVLIIQKQTSSSKDYPFQYELITQYLPKEYFHYKFVFDESEPIAQKASQYLHEVNNVSLIDGDTEFPYKI